MQKRSYKMSQISSAQKFYTLLIVMFGSFFTGFHTSVGKPDITSIHSTHVVQDVNFIRHSDCKMEAIAYAAALNALYDARRVADEAYRRWYECEQLRDGDDRMPLSNADQPPILSAEYSVLYTSP